MPIVPPRLDDRNFEDLVEELIARVPAHTPEWVPQAGDPGRTLLELFAWLGDALLYRANLIPERQRLVFLKLLGRPMRPAQAAQGLISVHLDNPDAINSVIMAKQAHVTGSVDFETLAEVTLLPVAQECYYKRPLSQEEKIELSDVLKGLQEFHGIDEEPDGYVTTPIFPEGKSNKTGLDLISETTDHCLWIALLAPSPEQVPEIKNSLAGLAEKAPPILNIGIAPAIETPFSLDQPETPGRISHIWEISTPKTDDKENPIYSRLTRILDSTHDLTRRGADRYILPGNPEYIGVLEGDVRKDSNAGVGDRPPRLDDPEKISRIVAWLRMRPAQRIESLAISWAGINAVEIDQKKTLQNTIFGTSDGSPDQVFQLPGSSVEQTTFELQVDEVDLGYVTWKQVADLATVGRDDSVFVLDSEAGTVTFGNGIFGRIPEPGRRIRFKTLRFGGGKNGNLPPSSLTEISGKDLEGNTIHQKLKVFQGLSTEGGEDPETLTEAEKRIPSWLQHRNRSVTEKDYKKLAAETPGVRLGRTEILPRFLPQQRRPDVPGVVSVMVWPYKEQTEAPNPRPDRPFIEKVYSYLNERRPLATELYVIGCQYIPIGISIGITVREGFGHSEVENNVIKAVRRYLWSLPPDGPFNEGWPLGKSVKDNELEVIVARTQGVNTVGKVNLFIQNNNEWDFLEPQGGRPAEITLRDWELPELQSVIVNTHGNASTDLRSLPPDGGGEGNGEIGGGGVGVPVVPEVC